MRARAGTKNFQDQAGAIDNLRLPAPFKVALLHWAQCRIYNDKPDRVFCDRRAQRFNIPGPEQGRRHGPRQSHRLGAHNLQVDGTRQSHRLFKMRLKRAPWCLGTATRYGPYRGIDDERALRRGGYGGFGVAQNSLDSLPPSKSWIGCAGITVEIACL